jgi:hypothetical protein
MNQGTHETTQEIGDVGRIPREEQMPCPRYPRGALGDCDGDRARSALLPGGSRSLCFA